MISGFAARVYSFAAKRIPVFRDFQPSVAEDVRRKLASGTVLDVGTGPGYLPILIVSGNPSLEAIGLDVSRDMIKAARKNAKHENSERVQLLVADVSEIGMRSESVDLAVATLSFHHWQDPSEAFDEIRRVLKKGGEAWIFEVNREVTPLSEEWMKKKYNPLVRKIAHLITRIVGDHSITVECAKEILREHGSKFARSEVGQLQPLLIKMTLTKK